MPESLTFLALSWRDKSGMATACLVEDFLNYAAVASTVEEALRKLKEYAEWQFENEALDRPDFDNPRLITVTVEVRPEYDTGARIYPCDDTVALEIPCVIGKESGGLYRCSIPVLDLRFSYHDPEAVKGLIAHFVKNELQGKTPRDLHRFNPVTEAALHELKVISYEKKSEEAEEEVPTLSSVAVKLGDTRSNRQKYETPFERNKEIEELVNRVLREQANVILVGEPGVGKSTMIAEAARRIFRTSHDKDAGKAKVQLWVTSASRLIAGMKYLGQWEERCESVIEELENVHGILVVENLLELVRVGGMGAADSVASFLIPFLQRGELRLISEVTPTELDACRRMLPGFADLFQVLMVHAFDENTAVRVIKLIGEAQERIHKVTVNPGVPHEIVRLFQRYMPYASFPGEAAQFTRRVMEKTARKNGPSALHVSDVVENFSSQTGLPENLLKDEVRIDYDEVIVTLESQVIGQSQACQIAAAQIITFKAGLNDPLRPIAVLLFCGPTGVGKTALARTLACYFFGAGEGSDRLIRLDMSEFAAFGSGEKILSKPDGNPSDFIQKVRQQPFSLILLDEIEKAAPEVFDLFLAVFDEGRITDRFGRLTNFRSSLIVMTSNLGAEGSNAIGFNDGAINNFEAAVRAFFRPELFNRIDSVVSFSPLTWDQIEAITRKELADLAKRQGLAQRGIQITATQAAVQFIAKAGYDRRYGARHLQRTVEKMVVNQIARQLAEKPDIREVTIQVDLQDNRIVCFMT